MSSSHTFTDGLVCKSLEEVQAEGQADPRVDSLHRPTPEQLDEGLVQQLVRSLSRQQSQHHENHHHEGINTPKDLEKRSDEKPWPSSTMTSQSEEDIIYVSHTVSKAKSSSSLTSSQPCLQVDWEANDKRNPANFSTTRKWVITATASALTGLSGRPDSVAWTLRS